MTGIRHRVAKLETIYGATAAARWQRWMRAATDEQLEAEIESLDQRIRDTLVSEGVNVDGKTGWELFRLAALPEMWRRIQALKEAQYA